MPGLMRAKSGTVPAGPWPRVGAVVAVGVVFGTVATLLNALPGDAVLDDSPRRVASLVVNSGAAWAGAAVLGGWLPGSAARGVVGGPVVLVGAVVAYYGLGAAAGSENPGGSPDLVARWALVALLAGPVLGAVGGGMRRRDVLGLVSALVVPVGVYAEQLWRGSGVPDPARPLAGILLVALATVGAAAAVGRYVDARRSSLAR